MLNIERGIEKRQINRLDFIFYYFIFILFYYLHVIVYFIWSGIQNKSHLTKFS